MLHRVILYIEIFNLVIKKKKKDKDKDKEINISSTLVF